VVTNVFK